MFEFSENTIIVCDDELISLFLVLLISVRCMKKQVPGNVKLTKNDARTQHHEKVQKLVGFLWK